MRPLKQVQTFMKGWHLDSYAGIGALTWKNDIPIPIIGNPQDVLIKVEASSVNPLDLMMTKGYGDRILKNLRENNHSLVLGRDFSGTVVGTGMDAQNDFKIGDQVYGATFPSSQGSHTEFVTASKFSVAKKPKNLNHLEAASLPFTALTAWSAMMVSAGMSSESQNKNPQFKVLVLGASGGVGTFAVQLLKALNYSVVAVSQDFEMVVKLGADVVLDYTAPSYQSDLQKLATFDVIFDFAGLENQALKFMDLLRPWSNAKLVTLMSPLLRSTDQDGLIAGSLKTLASVVATNAQTALSKNGTSYRYGYFMLNPYALQTITNLVEKGKIKPVIQEAFKLEHLPAAFEELNKGNTRGKIVIDHS